MKNPLYYLSEMTISARHGGGLTLMRVLGDDLKKFQNTISPTEYPVKGFENIDEIEEKELKLWKEPGNFVPKKMPARFTPQYFVNQTKRLFRIPNPSFINWDYYKIVYTEYLKNRIDVRHGKFLVVPQNVQSVILSNELHRRFNISYASWIMDDHLLTYDSNTDSFLYSYPSNFEKQFEYHLRNAKHVFCISPNLADFYKTRFDVDSTVLFSPTDPLSGSIESRSLNGEIRFCHFGRIWSWPLDAIEKFASQLEFLNATLDIYSHFPLEGALLGNPRVIVKKPVGAEEVTEKMKEYDAVTIFYGMNEDVRNLSEFNISTKMSECLASGLPVLFVGPEYGAMTKWAKAHGCGLVITAPEDRDQLSIVLNLRDPDFRADVTEKCLEVARQYSSTQAMKKVWAEGWNKVLNGKCIRS